MEKQGVDALLISQPENRFYLSGFTGSAGYLMLTTRETILAVDFRYVEQAKRESPGFNLFEIKGRMTEWMQQLLDEIEVQNIGFESDHITFYLYHELSNILSKVRPDIQLVPLNGVVDKLRAVKDETEIDLIQRAAMIADLAFDNVTAGLTPGITEKELAWRLEKTMRETGSQGMPFDVIVAAGTNSALPHAKPSDRVIKTGEPIVIDMGAVYGGYSSDLTRTICLGEPDATFQKIYGIVLRAQQKAIDGIVAGMDGFDADNIARNVIFQAGYNEKFGHSLGHGVGLLTHDPSPRLSPQASKEPLLNGMVFSIEPGIYLPEWGGVRIEDLVTLQNDKIKLLSRARKMNLDTVS